MPNRFHCGEARAGRPAKPTLDDLFGDDEAPGAAPEPAAAESFVPPADAETPTDPRAEEEFPESEEADLDPLLRRPIVRFRIVERGGQPLVPVVGEVA